MAPEESLYVSFSEARATLHLHWHEFGRKVVMVLAETQKQAGVGKR
jgi:hypothetical protein